jgi:predicted transposase/invertase (TIGR01784 family)
MIKEVSFLSTIQIPEIAAKKQSIVDVLCKDENGVQIIVEMQVSPQQGFEKRAQYYAAKAYSGQLNKGKEEGSRYVDLKAVVFIAISDNIIFPDKVFYKSDHIILDKDNYSHDLKDFSFTFIELPKFKITDISLLTNIIEKWCYFFKNANKTTEDDLIKIAGSDAMIQRAYDELNQFNWSEAELHTYDQEIKRIMDNRAAEDYKLEQAKAEGIEEGLEKGKVEGLAKGKTEERITIARNLLAQNIDINIISSVTGLSVKEIEKLKS